MVALLGRRWSGTCSWRRTAAQSVNPSRNVERGTTSTASLSPERCRSPHTLRTTTAAASSTTSATATRRILRRLVPTAFFPKCSTARETSRMGSSATDTSGDDLTPDVVAAGAVVVRSANGGEVLLVHRPKYDDWAWPKGKQDPGEHVTATAVREVLEETGVAVRLGRPLPRQLYLVSGSRAKHVHYWTGWVVGDHDVSGYAANSE